MCWGVGSLPAIVIQNEIIFLDSLFSVQKGKKNHTLADHRDSGRSYQTPLHPHSCIEREEEDGSCPVLEVCVRCLSCSTGSRKHWLLTQQPAVIQDSLESMHWYLAEMPWHEWAASVPSSFLCGPRRSNPSWRLTVVTTWERPVLWEVCSGVMSQSRSPRGKEVGLILGEPRREGRMNVLAYTNRMYFECRFSVMKCELWRAFSAGGPWKAAVELSWVYGSSCPV